MRARAASRCPVGAVARLAPLGWAIALSACYTFAPAAQGALPGGARVRVALTDAGSAALAPAVGSSVSAIEGEVVRWGGDTLVVRADRLLTTAGVDVDWAGSDLNVPTAWRGAVDRRRLAPGRTALLAAGGVAVSAGVIALVRRLGDHQGDAGGGGEPIRVSRGKP